MKRYRDKHAECEAWYKQVKMWEDLTIMLAKVPACTIGDESPVMQRIKQSHTAFDKEYNEQIKELEKERDEL